MPPPLPLLRSAFANHHNMLRLACLALCVAVVSAEGEGLYDGEDAVTSLTTETFKSLVMESSKPWLVEFYAPW